MFARYSSAFFAFLFFLTAAARAEDPLAAATVVVYNVEIPESVALAKFYAQKRGIAHDHLVPCIARSRRRSAANITIT